jgi:hypothetical protein
LAFENEHTGHEPEDDTDPLLKDFNGQVSESQLLPDFVLAGVVQMEPECPPGIVDSRVCAPLEAGEGKGTLLLTKESCFYRMEAALNLENIRE